MRKRKARGLNIDTRQDIPRAPMRQGEEQKIENRENLVGEAGREHERTERTGESPGEGSR